MSRTSPGSVHESVAFLSTLHGRRIKYPFVQDLAVAELIADGYCTVADETYGASELLAVPWPGGGGGDRWKDSYNFHEESSRIHIEQAFGMLVWRWGLLWRPLRVPCRKRPSLICACFRLRNFFRRWDANGDAPLAPYDRDGEAARTYFDDAPSDDVRGRHRACEGSSFRDRMGKTVEHLGRVRPYTPSLK